MSATRHRGVHGIAMLLCVVATLGMTRSAACADAAMRLGDSGISAPGAPLQKVGEARLRVMLWSIYNSRLYTPTGRYREGERPLRLEIEYLRDIPADTLISRTGDEWVAMGREHPRQEIWLQRLGDLWPDIRERDVLTLEISASNESVFLHNGQRLGLIDDPEFGQQFIDIWLSEDCTRPALREALLGTRNAN